MDYLGCDQTCRYDAGFLDKPNCSDLPSQQCNESSPTSDTLITKVDSAQKIGTQSNLSVMVAGISEQGVWDIPNT